MLAKDGKKVDLRHCWNYRFAWSPNHQTAEQLKPLRYTFDLLAAECWEPLQSIAATELGGTHARTKKNPCREDMFTLLKDNHHKNAALARLWMQVNTVPEWVDWEQIARGQTVFYRYGLSMLLALIFQSLLGGMAADNTVETLRRTGGFSAKMARRRLLETAQHTLQVMQSLESIRPGGAGHISTIRVRLLHVAVRNRIVSLANKNPAYYNMEKYGVPINDLDSMGTIHAFSTNVIWIGLPRQGINLSAQECEDYIALWRLVAYYIGAPTEDFETAHKARIMMESIMLSEILPTETSGVLARNLIIGLQNTPPLFASQGVLEAMARWLNGRDLADTLGLGNPGILSWVIVGWILCSTWLWAYIGGLSPLLRSMQVEASKRKFKSQVTNIRTGLAEETKFGFEHVPKE